MYTKKKQEEIRALVSSLNGPCYRVLGIKTKWKDCVKCPHPVYRMRYKLVCEGDVQRPGFSHWSQPCVPRAEVTADEPLFSSSSHLLQICGAKVILKRFKYLAFVNFGMFRATDAVNEAGTFTGEGINEIEGLM